MKRFLMTLAVALFASPLFVAPVAADSAATKMVNDVRAAKGRKAIAYSQRLERVAQGHADDMASKGYFSHTGANGSSVGQRAKRAGYKWCYVAENIAKGQGSLQAVMNSWVTSAGHYKNITNRKAREFAIARGRGNVWVMVLAKPC